jgi:hypothetical protein
MFFDNQFLKEKNMELKPGTLVFVRSRECWGVVISLSPLLVETYEKAGRIATEADYWLHVPRGTEFSRLPQSRCHWRNADRFRRPDI